MTVCAVVGGQFGSEGKGAIVAHIARDYDVHVRVGAANAGHTFYTKRLNPEGLPRTKEIAWEKRVMQQIPCAAYANPDAVLMIGPGALISPDIMSRELDKLSIWRAERGLQPIHVFIDPRAHVISEFQVEMEARSGLDRRIGSTSATAREGIGWAQADRVMRSEHCITAQLWYGDDDPFDSGIKLAYVPLELSPVYDQKILLEGTQGAGLSLTTGDFPYVTSRNTTVAGLCADVGIAPQRVDRTILVVRTFPIRVAGNSGPFYSDSGEIQWESIGVDPETERTTVTKKVRRVAIFSVRQVQDAVLLNGATEIALMFCDYLDGGLQGRPVNDLIESIEAATGVPIRYLGFGPHHIIDRGERS